MGKVLPMSRLEKYKEKRKRKRRYIISLIFVLTLFITGIFVADYSVNYMISGEKKTGVFNVQSRDGTHTDIIIFDRKLTLNTYYLQRDYKNLIKFIKNIF
ncbi:MAG: hypothetical protein Q8920_00750 [Bacillota bacterium]|nr:hypothetical protein [Bacillota bacterium]